MSHCHGLRDFLRQNIGMTGYPAEVVIHDTDNANYLHLSVHYNLTSECITIMEIYHPTAISCIIAWPSHDRVQAVLCFSP
jgi:hypothetical protein